MNFLDRNPQALGAGVCHAGLGLPCPDGVADGAKIIALFLETRRRHGQLGAERRDGSLKRVLFVMLDGTQHGRRHALLF